MKIFAYSLVILFVLAACQEAEAARLGKKLIRGTKKVVKRVVGCEGGICPLRN